LKLYFLECDATWITAVEKKIKNVKTSEKTKEEKSPE
jgi:hypothetical protein